MFVRRRGDIRAARRERRAKFLFNGCLTLWRQRVLPSLDDGHLVTKAAELLFESAVQEARARRQGGGVRELRLGRLRARLLRVETYSKPDAANGWHHNRRDL